VFITTVYLYIFSKEDVQSMMNWFFASGDLDFFWKEELQALSFLPTLWAKDIGMGQSGLLSLWLDYPFRVFIKTLSLFGISWWVTDVMLWIGVFGLGIYASHKLAAYILSGSRFSWLSSLIYMSNTYILLLFGGGQLGVALAYSLSPLVLLKFIQTIDRSVELGGKKYEVRKSCINGLWLALLVCFDLRLAYLVIGLIILYLVFSIWPAYRQGRYLVSNKKFILNTLYQILYTLLIPILVASLIHMFWIFPLLMVRGELSGLSEEFTNAGMLKFLSVADYSHTLSLLHPNWPENLFGKVYFLQPEFLVLPMLAFSALACIGHRTMSMGQNYKAGDNEQGTQFICFFALLALIGVFLAKGANDPFGGVYVWLFKYVPGFFMFRDPTKFYLFIAIGYSILIPYALHNIAATSRIWYLVFGIWYKKKNEKFILNTRYVILYTIFIGFWCFTIRPLFLGQLSGNFHPQQIPSEIVELKDLLVRDTKPSRVLWLPKQDLFAYSSVTHPILSGEILFKNASLSGIIKLIDEPMFEEKLTEAGVGYVIVPIDIEKRIFLSDYRFDQQQRETLVSALSNTNLVRVQEFNDAAVFLHQHPVFQSDVPLMVDKQEYWSKIGLVISMLTILTCSILVWKTKKYI